MAIYCQQFCTFFLLLCFHKQRQDRFYPHCVWLFFSLKTYNLFHSVEIQETGCVDLAIVLSTPGQKKCNLSWKCTTARGCLIYVTALGNQATRNNKDFAEEVLQACPSCNSQPVLLRWSSRRMPPFPYCPEYWHLTCLDKFPPLCVWTFSSYGDFSPP